MIRLKAIELRNIVHYQKARFPLDRVGLSVVYGLNKDSSAHPDKSNGAGKSLPFTTLMEVLADQHPLVEGRNTVADGFQEKGALAAVEFDDYRLEKFKSGKSMKYDLFKSVSGEWKPTKVRTNDYVWQRMSTLFPLSNDELFSLYYIDSGRPSDIQRGKHTERLKLLSTLLQLDRYDVMQAEVKALIKALKDTSAKLEEVENQIALYEEDVVEDSATGELEELREKQTKLTAKRKEAARLVNLKTVYDAYHHYYSHLRAFWKKQATRLGYHLKDASLDFLDPDDCVLLSDALTEGVSALTKRISKVKKAQNSASTRKHLQARLRELEATARERDVVGLRKQLAEATAELERNEELTAKIDALKKKPKPKPIGFDPEADYSQAFEDADKQLLLSERALSIATADVVAFKKQFKGEDCQCPTCKQELDSGQVKRMLSHLTSQQAEAERNSEAAAVHKGEIEACLGYAEWRAKINSLRHKLSNVTVSAVADLQAEVDLAESQHAQWLECQRIREELANAPEPTDDDLDELENRRSSYEQALRAVQGLDDAGPQLREAIEADAGSYNLTQLQSGLEKLEVRLDELSAKITALARLQGNQQVLAEKLEDLAARRKELKRELRDLPVLKALEDAYSQKGMKNLCIRNACKTIEFNLNREASTVFSEPTKFVIEVDETHMHILVTRGKGGRVKTTDVRRLSAAESQAFNLIWPLAIYPLQPDSRRLNVAFLDEPTAKMDQPGIDLFFERYLPRLQTIVPHVVVISPVPLPLDPSKCNVWRVTREGGISTLEPVKVNG